MKSILGELYYGDICPADQGCPNDKEYKELGDKIVKETDYFTKTIPEGDFKRFDDFCSLMMEESSLLSKEAFVYGYKLATAIMLEVLTGRESLFQR